MALFPDTLGDELSRLGGAQHSFLKQVATEQGAPLRHALEDTAARVGPEVARRWSDLLSSLDNRRFFQAVGEAMLVGQLLERGWSAPALSWPGPGLLLRDRTGISWYGLFLSFLRPVRVAVDQQTTERLRRAVNRAGVRRRVGMVVHRWLPSELDPEPIRRAVELWLREVDRGTWSGRYAAYEDEQISLEFVLTGERVERGHDVVAFVLGPYLTHPTVEAVGGRVIWELERVRLDERAPTLPILVGCASDQPWRTSPGFVRELLYGRAAWQTTGGPAGQEWAFGQDDAPGLFRDPLYSRVSAVLFGAYTSPPAAQCTAWQNPWALSPLRPERFTGPTFTVRRWSEGAAVMGWETAR